MKKCSLINLLLAYLYFSSANAHLKVFLRRSTVSLGELFQCQLVCGQHTAPRNKLAQTPPYHCADSHLCQMEHRIFIYCRVLFEPGTPGYAVERATSGPA